MPSIPSWRGLIAATTVVLFTGFVYGSDGPGDPLVRGFQTPPDSAKPRVWWHWMNGNVTPEGITADLEWMHRVGIGGFQMFDAYLSVPQFVDHRVVWYTPEWKAAFRHAAAEADRLGLEMAMAGSGGWSESGGPSVTPDPQAALNAMMGYRDKADTGFLIAKARFDVAARIDHWQDKAGFGLAMDYGTVPTPPAAPDEVVAPGEVVDLTARMRPDGTIDWDAPEGARLLRPGPNHLEVRVTNLWPNRIIGDQALPVEQRHTFTVFRAFTKDSPLLVSGLLGPVTLQAMSPPGPAGTF